MSDRLLKFLFHAAPVRGEVVQLASVWKQMIEHHDYPPAVLSLLGEMSAAATLLAANIKFAGTLILQIHGDGPVSLLVVECQPDLGLRATAKLRPGSQVAANARLAELVNQNGQGRCAITLDPSNRAEGQQPYQGIVPLEGESIAQALEAYMRMSEQLDTRLWLAANEHTASGLLLQRLPQEGGSAASATDEDAWNRASHLASTLQSNELTELPPEQVIHRLFWQEKLERASQMQPRFECRCSRDRISRMLLALGREEVDSIVSDEGQVEVICDFCSRKQRFDAVDVGALFANGVGLTPPSPASKGPH